MKTEIFADLSNNNGSFDAKAYRDAGHVAVALKCTEGVGFVDFRHRGWALAAGLHHIAVFHYHFADTTSSPDAEAAHFLTHALPLCGPRDYLVLDMERGSLAHDPAWARGFDAHVRQHTRFRGVILYGSRSWLADTDAQHWLAGDPYRFWDADWSTSRDFAPRGGVCVIRQSSDGVFGPDPHALAGIGRCDVNYMRGGFAAKVLSKA